MGRRGSKSSSISERAASASSAVSAATKATGSAAVRTLSSASTRWSWTASPYRFTPGRSAAVSTARTPGMLLALAVSMPRMIACGAPDQRIRACNIPAICTSPTYLVAPTAFSNESILGTLLPIHRFGPNGGAGGVCSCSWAMCSPYWSRISDAAACTASTILT